MITAIKNYLKRRRDDENIRAFYAGHLWAEMELSKNVRAARVLDFACAKANFCFNLGVQQRVREIDRPQENVGGVNND